MKVGYVRVSTKEQNTARQDVLMTELGVEKVYVEKVSAKDTKRPQLQEMMNFVREGDTVIVESFSRFARTTRDLLTLTDELDQKKVVFISKKEQIDTTTPSGRFMLTLFGAMAQMERETILERQKEGIDIAKGEGKYLGRKPIEIDEELFARLYKDWKNGETQPKYMIKKLGLSRNTFYRRVKEYEEKIGIVKEAKK